MSYTGGMLSAALAGALLLAALPVIVESDDCPSGAQIEQMLAALLPTTPEGIRPDVARVKKRTVGLRVELTQADGRVIAERVLERQGSCTELAELAAVVIASWESDVHPEFVRPQNEPTPGPVMPVPTAHRRSPGAYDVGLGASLSHAGSWTGGGVLSLTWIPGGTGLGLRLLGAVDAQRTVDLETGRARWRRWTGSAELDWRLASLPLDLHGGVALGWLVARGVDFADSQTTVSFSPAATLGARLAWWPTRHLALWLDVTGFYWTRVHKVYADPPLREQELPRLAGLASVGLAFGRIANNR